MKDYRITTKTGKFYIDYGDVRNHIKEKNGTFFAKQSKNSTSYEKIDRIEKRIDIFDSPEFGWKHYFIFGTISSIILCCMGASNNTTATEFILPLIMCWIVPIFPMMLWAISFTVMMIITECFSIYKKLPDSEIKELIPNNTKPSTKTTTQTRKNLLFTEDKLNTYISKETNKLSSNNYNSLSKEDKQAIFELAKMNVLNNSDYMKYAFSATDKELEKIYTDLEIKEQKKIANHSIFEGRINSTDKRNLKNMLGFTCSACGKNMESIYGPIGRNYIELHHLIPYSEMLPNDTRTLSAQDFCVLCPDCHRMIHKLDNANDIDLLKRMIKLNQHKI